MEKKTNESSQPTRTNGKAFLERISQLKKASQLYYYSKASGIKCSEASKAEVPQPKSNLRKPLPSHLHFLKEVSKRGSSQRR
jgi:hypothetical protein